MSKKQKQTPEASKDVLKTIKQGAINKKKHSKFALTPKSKVPLINNFDKNNRKSSTNGHLSSKNSPTSLNTSKKSPGKVKKVEEEENDDDASSLDESINEGIPIEIVKEIISGPDDSLDEDDGNDSPDDALDIFGQTFSDDSSNDGIFEVCDDIMENQGVKMFKGVKSNESDATSNDEDDDEENEDAVSESEEESTDDELVATPPQKKTSKSKSKESDDDDGDDEVDEKSTKSGDADIDSDESDEADIQSGPGLAALLGDTIVEDSDDESFEGDEHSDDDEDDDISENDDDQDVDGDDEHSTGNNGVISEEEEEENEEEDDIADKSTASETDAERDLRTLFIGNLPSDIKKSRLKGEFKKYGTIESIRIRGIVPEDPRISYKVAAITGKIHPQSPPICAFITYKENDSVGKAMVMNGKLLENHYLKVDSVSSEHKKYDKDKAVFLGNLPFTIEDNLIWDTFKKCGKITSVRVVRDRKSGLGRGFGYINFESADGAVLALKLNGTELKNREVRVKIVKETQERPRNKNKRKRPSSGNDEDGSPKKVKTESGAAQIAARNSTNAEKRLEKKKKRAKARSQGQAQRKTSSSSGTEAREQFQGEKADGKKKNKLNKNAKKKKQMAAVLMSKSKKPAN